MSNLSPFPFTSRHTVRAFEQDGIVWFVAADVCAALEIKNVTQALEKLDEDERSMLNIGRSEIHGGGGAVNIINESGLYILLLRSRQAMTKGTTAWRFRKWVTSEVLPSLRKTGSYSVDPSSPTLPNLKNDPEAKDKYLRLSKQALLQFGAVLFLYKISEFGIFGLQRLKPLYAMQVPLKIG